MDKRSDIIFFCHGAPGSPQDAEIVVQPIGGPQLIAFDMFGTSSGDAVSDAINAFDRLADSAEDRLINVVGFSIGAMVAIKIAAARPNKVGRLTLVSPAAPLQLGHFLPNMAGKPIFELAQSRPKMLALVTKIQSCISAVAPNFLVNQLFRKCGDTERRLLSDKKFRDIIKSGFENSFRRNPDKYVNLLRSYVTDWSADLGRISCPVTIWHGEKDSWSPPSMSRALVEALSGTPELHVVKDGEHYSTLIAVQLD